MNRETTIDMVKRHIEFCRKYDEKFSMFPVNACEDILFYLENRESDDHEGKEECNESCDQA